MNPIEDRLVVAHLLDDPFQRVVRHDRRRRILRVPDIEILAGLEIDTVAVGDDQGRVGVENLEKSIQFIREQDIVVGAKGTIG
jgi:hypothetical protein